MNTIPFLQSPIDAVVFDCDSTLSRVEGVDELADTPALKQQIANLTEQAMSHSGLSLELYRDRLQLIKPHQTRLQQLADQYYSQRTPGVEATLAVLVSLKKPLFVISAGVNPSVVMFAQKLGFNPARVYAVDLQFDASGAYQDFNQASPLVRKNGKREIITKIQQHYPRVAHIGDGLNDLEAMDLVTRFIGYGGACFRQQLAEQCQFYLKDPSLLATLPLLLTAAEAQSLCGEHVAAYQAGLQLLLNTCSFN